MQSGPGEVGGAPTWWQRPGLANTGGSGRGTAAALSCRSPSARFCVDAVTVGRCELYLRWTEQHGHDGPSVQGGPGFFQFAVIGGQLISNAALSSSRRTLSDRGPHVGQHRSGASHGGSIRCGATSVYHPSHDATLAPTRLATAGCSGPAARASRRAGSVLRAARPARGPRSTEPASVHKEHDRPVHSAAGARGSLERASSSGVGGQRRRWAGLRFTQRDPARSLSAERSG